MARDHVPSGAARGLAAAVVLVALAACGWIEAGLAPFRAGSTALTLGAAAVLVALGMLADRSARAPRAAPAVPGSATGRGLSRAGLAAWAVSLCYAVVVELWEYFRSPRSLHPTLSSLANEVIGPGHRPARACAFVAWGLGCVGLARRPRRRP